MRRLSLVLAAGMLCCFYATVSADIYVWTDDNGVKHCTNSVPPAGAEILMQTAEIPYDEKADKDRMEAEQLEKVIAARQEVADMEAQLIEMQQVAERRLEEANRKAQEALEYAESLMTGAQQNYNGFSGRRIRYFGHYPYHNNFKQSHYKRWYYPKKDNIYYKSPHHNYHESHYKKQLLNKHPDKYNDKRRQVRHRERSKTRNKNYGYRSRNSRFD
jgi:hypothetical protein